jgi:hypothetical protein
LLHVELAEHSAGLTFHDTSKLPALVVPLPRSSLPQLFILDDVTSEADSPPSAQDACCVAAVSSHEQSFVVETDECLKREQTAHPVHFIVLDPDFSLPCVFDDSSRQTNVFLQASSVLNELVPKTAVLGTTLSNITNDVNKQAHRLLLKPELIHLRSDDESRSE